MTYAKEVRDKRQQKEVMNEQTFITVMLWSVSIVFVIVFIVGAWVYVASTVSMPTPESIAADQIRKNYATCHHHVVYGSQDNTFVEYHGKTIFLARERCE